MTLLPRYIENGQDPSRDLSYLRRVAVCGVAGRGLGFTRAALLDSESILRYVCEWRGGLRARLEQELPLLHEGTWRGYRAKISQVNLSRLLADRTLSGVIVVGECEVRPDLVGALLRAGKHVLVEEPLALAAVHARALIADAAARGLNLMVTRSARAAARAAQLSPALDALGGSCPPGATIAVRRRGRERSAWLDWLVEDLLALTDLAGPLALRAVTLAGAWPALTVELAGAGGVQARLGYHPAGRDAAGAVLVEIATAGRVIARHEATRASDLELITRDARAPLDPDLLRDWQRFRASLSPAEVGANPIDTGDDRPGELGFIDTLEGILAAAAPAGSRGGRA